MANVVINPFTGKPDLTGSGVPDGGTTGQILSKQSNANGDTVWVTPSAASVADGSITTAKLADNAVTTVKILDANITDAKLASNAVTTSKINASAVTDVKIANNAVTTTKILDANVTTAKIADSNITTIKIADSNVTEAKLSTGAVTLNKIASNAVDSTKLADNSVLESKINNSAVTTNKIADGAVQTAKVADGAITTTKINDGAVSSAKVAVGAITTTLINDNAVSNVKLAQVATKTYKGRTTAGTGNVEDLTVAQMQADLGILASPSSVLNLTAWAGLFNANYVVATEASPTTGNITYDFTGAVLGTKIIIFHNSSTIPTFPATTRFINGVYIPNIVNRIELVLDVASTIVNCTISQPASIIIPDLKQGFSIVAQTINITGTAFGTGTTNIASSASLGAIDEMVVDATEARGRTPYSSNMFIPGSCNWLYDIKFKTPSVLSNSTDRYVIFLGTGTTVTNPHSSSSRCGIVYSDNINSGKFNLEVGAATSLDLGVTVAANTEYHIVMEHRNGTIRVWINGSLSGTLVATPSTSASRPMYNIANTAGTATFTMQVGPLNFGIYDY